MRSFSIILMLLLLFLPVPIRSASERLTIFTPPSTSYIETQRINVVVRVDRSSVDSVEIMVDNQKKNLAPDRVAVSFFHFKGVSLAPGMNTIKVAGFAKDRLVEEKELQVFFRSDLSHDSSPPAGFERYFFHTPAQGKVCSLCHEVNNGGISRTPSEPKKSPCFSCHNSITEQRFVHGPAAVWFCSACHDTDGKTRKNRVAKPDEKACSKCHEDSLESWKNMSYGHGPTAMGNCLTCHNPHGSDQPFFLKLHAADLCLSCHTDVASRPHLISSPTGNGGHPLRVSPDPFNPDRDFSCASCHNPHAGSTASLLNNFKGSMSRFCMNCHNF